jgi:hypothetical protein
MARKRSGDWRDPEHIKTKTWTTGVAKNHHQ